MYVCCLQLPAALTPRTSLLSMRAAPTTSPTPSSKGKTALDGGSYRCRCATAGLGSGSREVQEPAAAAGTPSALPWPFFSARVPSPPHCTLHHKGMPFAAAAADPAAATAPPAAPLQPCTCLAQPADACAARSLVAGRSWCAPRSRRALRSCTHAASSFLALMRAQASQRGRQHSEDNGRQQKGPASAQQPACKRPGPHAQGLMRSTPIVSYGRARTHCVHCGRTPCAPSSGRGGRQCPVPLRMAARARLPC